MGLRISVGTAETSVTRIGQNDKAHRASCEEELTVAPHTDPLATARLVGTMIRQT